MSAVPMSAVTRPGEVPAAIPTLPPPPTGSDVIRRPVHLARLTDEELVLLAVEHPVVVLPDYERLAPAAREVAVRTAHRSLLARGAPTSADPDLLAVPQEVSDLLDIRGGAPWVLVIRRAEHVVVDGVERPVQTERYAHLVDDLVLLEDVSADGVHDFFVLDDHALATELQDFLTHDDIRDGSPRSITFDLPAIAQGRGDVDLTQLGRLKVEVDATLWRRGPQPAPILLGLLLGVDGCWVTRNTYGAAGPLELQPVLVRDLGATVVELLHERRRT